MKLPGWTNIATSLRLFAVVDSWHLFSVILTVLRIVDKKSTLLVLNAQHLSVASQARASSSCQFEKAFYPRYSEGEDGSLRDHFDGSLPRLPDRERRALATICDWCSTGLYTILSMEG